MTPTALFLDRSDRIRLEVIGPDRAKFLHNLTTQDVKRLAAGRGAEAFVTSPQGKTIGFVTLIAGDDRVTVRADPGGADLVLPHFRKYGVFDDVSVDDVSGRTFEFHVFGPNADAVVRGAGGAPPEEGDLRHAAANVGGRPVVLVREGPLGLAGLTVVGDLGDAGAVRQAIHDAGAALGLADAGGPTAEALRIAAGTPVYPRDLGPNNLPQEVGRDARAINFVKGCYLGQETVARIDALGHVNRLLRGLTLPGGEVPPDGSVIEAGGKAVGAITSAALSPGRGGVVALGYVRTSHAQAGTAAEVVVGDARLAAVVTDLPMPPA